MATLEESICSRLSTDPAITALIAEDRIYPGRIPPHDAPSPWVYYEITESQPLAALGTVQESQNVVELTIIADEYASAKQLADAIKSSLNGYRGGQILRAFWANTARVDSDEGAQLQMLFNMRATDGPMVAVQAGLPRVEVRSDGLYFGGDLVGPVAPDATAAHLDQVQTFAQPQTITAPSGASVPLTVQGVDTAGNQTAALIRWRDTEGRFGQIDFRGAIIGPGASGIDSTGAILDFATTGPANLGGIRMNGGDGADNNVLQTGLRNLGFAVADAAAFSIVFRTASRRLVSVGSVAMLNDPTLIFWSQAGTATDRQVGSFEAVFADSADASRKGRVSLLVWDAAGKREAIRAESDGTQPRLGFFGQSAVARPSLTYSRTGETAAAAQLRAALSALGLVQDSTTA